MPKTEIEPQDARVRRMRREIAELEYQIKTCERGDYFRLSIMLQHRRDGLALILKD